MIPRPKPSPVMTLCIAALTKRWVPATLIIDGVEHPTRKIKPAVLMAYDRRVEGVGKSETARKLLRLSPQWWVLYAGNVSDVIELLWRYRARFSKPIDEYSVVDALWGPLNEQKERRAARGAPCSDVSSESFELLAIGFVSGDFRLYRFISDDGEWRECETFACIGRGWYVAEAILTARETTALRLAPEMIYRIYEALRIGSVVPTVGSNASLSMLTADDERVQLRSIENDAQLKKLWERFGLREIGHVDWQETDFRWTDPS